MKRVTFKTAKALKEFGYPQERDDRTVLYPTKGEFKGTLCTFNSCAPERDKDSVNAPTYYEVLNWLWSAKNIHITFDYSPKLEKVILFSDSIFVGETPEDCIAKAIEYMADKKFNIQ